MTEKKDIETPYIEMYNVYVDKKIIEATRKHNPLSSLIPKYGYKQKIIKKLDIKKFRNKIRKFINKIRLKLAFWIGGKELDEYVEDSYDDY